MDPHFRRPPWYARGGGRGTNSGGREGGNSGSLRVASRARKKKGSASWLALRLILRTFVRRLPVTVMPRPPGTGVSSQDFIFLCYDVPNCF